MDEDKNSFFLYRGHGDEGGTRYFIFDRQLPPDKARSMKLIGGYPDLTPNQQTKINRLVPAYHGGQDILLATIQKILREK